MKMIVTVLLGTLALNAMADGPTISDVVVRQRWPWSRLVDINYVLTCEESQHMDVTLSAYNGETSLTLPYDSLSGDLYNVTEGARHIVWDPLKTAYTNRLITQFQVTLTPTNPPVYMVVDLTKTAGTEGQIEYIYPGDSRLVTEGRFTNIWHGATNFINKTDKMVLRRISAGTFTMGESSGTKSVTLTKDFYIAVFELTQGQYERVVGVGASPGAFKIDYKIRPLEQLSYDSFRGATNSVPSINWPSTGHQVLSSSFVGRLRTLTGVDSFDLPTDAQWEYACRAGTTTVFNDGDPSANFSGVNSYTNEWLNALGRYKYNGGYVNGATQPDNATCSTSNGTAAAGSYLPNAWGLYDMHGNVHEFCLDWYTSALPGGSDPEGSTSGTERVRRGGGWWNEAYQSRSAGRLSLLPSSGSLNIGFRLVVVLP